MHHRPAILLLILVPQVGCGVLEPPIAEQPVTVAPLRNPKIPNGVSYPIVRDQEESNALSKKRMVDVRLNTKVPADVLREIALEVKKSEKHEYIGR